MFLRIRMKRFAVLAAALLLGGCAGIPADRGLSASNALMTLRGGLEVAAPHPEEEMRKLTAEWLAAPLTVESAQRIALTRNPRLLAQYARLGIAQAEVYEAARISNPLFSFAWLDGNAGGAQLALGLAQNFADLLYLSPRKRLARGGLTRTQQQVAGDLLALAAEVEGSYYAYIGTAAVSDLRVAIATAGEALAGLAQRFFDAGNISRLQLNREQAAASAARIAADSAAAEMLAARAALNNLLGVMADEDRWTAPTRLPLPVTEEDQSSDLQRLAATGRLDLIAARGAVTLLEDSLGVTRSFRLLGDVQLGVDYEHETDGSRLLGPTLGLTLPVFNWGAGRVERARSELDLALAEARQLEIQISNDLRLAQGKVASARVVIERYRSQLIPQREEVVRRAMEMQNYMLIGQFEVLQAKQQEFDAYQGYLEALGLYWQSRAQLAKAVGARLPSTAQVASAGVEPEALIQPGIKMNDVKRMEEMDHAGHDMGAMKAAPAEGAHAGHVMHNMDQDGGKQ